MKDSILITQCREEWLLIFNKEELSFLKCMLASLQTFCVCDENNHIMFIFQLNWP